MGTVLRTLADLGYFGVWRVLDSQHFGVAQRRRRVFGVFAEGRAGGERCAELLLEPEGGGWTPTTRGSTGEGTTEGSGYSVANTLKANKGRGWNGGAEETYVPDVASPIAAGARSGSGGYRRSPEDTYIFQQNQRNELRLMGGDGQQAGALAAYQGMKQQNYVAFTPGHSSPRGDGGDNLVAFSLPAVHRGVGQAWNTNYTVGPEPAQRSAGVRRLVPVEVERLQGFPDNWTAHGSEGPIADTHRYRMMGNAVTTNVAYWIALRMRSIIAVAGFEEDASQ